MTFHLRWLFPRSSEEPDGADATAAADVSENTSSFLRRCDLVEKRANLLWNAEGCIPGRQFYCRLRAEEEVAAELGERQI